MFGWVFPVIPPDETPKPQFDSRGYPLPFSGLCYCCGTPMKADEAKYVHKDGRVACVWTRNGDCRRPLLEGLLSEGFKFYSDES